MSACFVELTADVTPKRFEVWMVGFDSEDEAWEWLARIHCRSPFIGIMTSEPQPLFSPELFLVADD